MDPKSGIWPQKWVPEGVTHWSTSRKFFFPKFLLTTFFTTFFSNFFHNFFTTFFQTFFTTFFTTFPQLFFQLFSRTFFHNFSATFSTTSPTCINFSVSRSNDVWTRFWGQIWRFRSYLVCLPSDFDQISCGRSGGPRSGGMPPNPLKWTWGVKSPTANTQSVVWCP